MIANNIKPAFPPSQSPSVEEYKPKGGASRSRISTPALHRNYMKLETIQALCEVARALGGDSITVCTLSEEEKQNLSLDDEIIDDVQKKTGDKLNGLRPIRLIASSDRGMLIHNRGIPIPLHCSAVAPPPVNRKIRGFRLCRKVTAAGALPQSQTDYPQVGWLMLSTKESSPSEFPQHRPDSRFGKGHTSASTIYSPRWGKTLVYVEGKQS